MNDEKKEILEKINREETMKLKLTETLKETTRISAELKINSNVFDDEKLNEILKKGSEDLNQFNKDLLNYLYTL